METKAAIILDVQMIQDGEYVVAYNPELKISSFGKTADDAFNAFEEMLHLWVLDTREMGTFEELINKAGLNSSDQNSKKSFDFRISEPDSSFLYNDTPVSIIETRQKKLELF